MVKVKMGIRIKAVVLSEEGIKTDKEISSFYGISDRTLRRWKKAYRIDGFDDLTPKSTAPKLSRNKTDTRVERRISHLKQKYPSWGARRIKYQPAFTTTENILITKDNL